MDLDSLSQQDQVYEDNDVLMMINDSFNASFQQIDNNYPVYNAMDQLSPQYLNFPQFQETSELQQIKSQETTEANTPERPFKKQEHSRKSLIVDDSQRCFRLFQQNSLTAIGTILNLEILKPLSVVPIKKKVLSKQKLKKKTNNNENVEVVKNMDMEQRGLDDSKDLGPQIPQYQCDKCLKSFMTSTGLGGHTSRVHPNSSEKYNKKIQTQKKNEVKRNRKVMMLKVSQID